MYCKITSFTIDGIEARPVTVEVSVCSGLAHFSIIGLADQATKESKERVDQALRHGGYSLPPGNITVNLAPADIKKKGSQLDLPIALGILIASAQITSPNLLEYMIAGELSLQGKLLPCRGMFNGSLLANELGVKYFLCPPQTLTHHASHLNYLEAQTLAEALRFLECVQPPLRQKKMPLETTAKTDHLDYSEVLGQLEAKRAIEVAVLGGLNLLFIGPPGCGKSMLLKRLPSVLPPLSDQEQLEVTKVHAVYRNDIQTMVEQRPFREVGPDISMAGLLGGGNPFLPGEISLSHRGVLFLDELSEYSTHLLQSLRSPMQERQIVIRRSTYHVTLPSHFMLTAATNPCPCGFYGDEIKLCRCPPSSVERLYRRISGPILDRIPLILYLQPPRDAPLNGKCARSSAKMRERILSASQRLRKNQITLQGVKVLLELKWVNQCMRKAINGGLVTRRKLLSTIWVAYLLSLLENETFREEHLFTALHYCQTQGILPQNA